MVITLPRLPFDLDLIVMSALFLAACAFEARREKPLPERAD